MPALQLTLIARSYCHLCEDMQVAVEQFAARTGVQIRINVVDLDEHVALEDRFGELIPVLLLGDGVDGAEICHHFLDEGALGRTVSV